MAPAESQRQVVAALEHLAANPSLAAPAPRQPLWFTIYSNAQDVRFARLLHESRKTQLLIVVRDAWQLARLQNLRAVESHHTLVGLPVAPPLEPIPHQGAEVPEPPLPELLPPPPAFPRDVHALRTCTAPTLTELLDSYGQPTLDNVEQKRARFAVFIGAPSYQTVDDGSPATSLGSSLYSSCSSAATEYEANPQFNDPEFDSDAEDAKDKFLYRYCYQCPFAVDRKDAWIPYDRQLQRTVLPSYTTPMGSPMMHGFHPMMTPVHPAPPAQYAAPSQVYHHPAYATTPTYQVQPSPVIDHYALSFPSNAAAMQDVANFFASMSGFRAEVNTSWVPYMVIPCQAAASMPYTYYLRPHGGHSGTTFPPGMSFMVGSDCQVTVTRDSGPFGYQHPSGFGHPPPPTGFYCYAGAGGHYPPQSAPYPSAPNFNDYGRYEEPGSFGRRRRAYSSAGHYDEPSSDEEDSEDEMGEEQGRSSRPTRSRTYCPSRRQSDPTDDCRHFNQTYSGRERSSRPRVERNTEEPRPLPEMGFTDLLKDGRYKGRYFVGIKLTFNGSLTHEDMLAIGDEIRRSRTITHNLEIIAIMGSVAPQQSRLFLAAPVIDSSQVAFWKKTAHRELMQILRSRRDDPVIEVYSEQH
ncbi:uncharacterized protein EHS24_006907 [Apiotrichum porosum]|uniref:Uncharacterized protein n=1 Tax=Apiotrichum porosum TaxID=105984 RepID=A0A427XWM1_9TREE|nr:uncharacterized protein EHS24_006907 [Apiotrichum porosum]RSH83240.1 hypothetical protein EHS24_006907 [Apiotrichum porosum]